MLRLKKNSNQEEVNNVLKRAMSMMRLRRDPNWGNGKFFKENFTKSF